mmetsp:Transcript_65811/g.206112  ORF Transcript_65811/g.206112 Transcript_65811/m.206112 type:complete len:272 (-) Transcript_65811:996-1811(-)
MAVAAIPERQPTPQALPLQRGLLCRQGSTGVTVERWLPRILWVWLPNCPTARPAACPPAGLRGRPLVRLPAHFLARSWERIAAGHRVRPAVRPRAGPPAKLPRHPLARPRARLVVRPRAHPSASPRDRTGTRWWTDPAARPRGRPAASARACVGAPSRARLEARSRARPAATASASVGARPRRGAVAQASASQSPPAASSRCPRQPSGHHPRPRSHLEEPVAKPPPRRRICLPPCTPGIPAAAPPYTPPPRFCPQRLRWSPRPWRAAAAPR